jgi:hypothetical protein
LNEKKKRQENGLSVLALKIQGSKSKKSCHDSILGRLIHASQDPCP